MYREINTFDQVVARYEAIKPVVSVRHTLQDDIRPIGTRTAKFERIIKYSDDCYALEDGGFCAPYRDSNNNAPARRQYEKAMAPIVWERSREVDEHGAEKYRYFIRIRGAFAGRAPISRYNFLYRYLPKGLAFDLGNGRQYIKTKIKPSEYFQSHQVYELPKTTYKYGGEEDGAYLYFEQHKDDSGDYLYTRIGKYRITTGHIDKEKKAMRKGDIEGVWGQLMAIGPMIDVSWYGKNIYIDTIQNFPNNLAKSYPPATRPGPVMNLTFINCAMPQELIDEVVANPEHELRMALVGLIAAALCHEDTPKAYRAKFNKLMNELCNLHKVVEQ